MPVEPEDLRAVAAVAVAPQRTRVDDEAAAPRLGIVGVLLLLPTAAAAAAAATATAATAATDTTATTASATPSTTTPARYSYHRALG